MYQYPPTHNLVGFGSVHGTRSPASRNVPLVPLYHIHFYGMHTWEHWEEAPKTYGGAKHPGMPGSEATTLLIRTDSRRLLFSEPNNLSCWPVSRGGEERNEIKRLIGQGGEEKERRDF